MEDYLAQINETLLELLSDEEICNKLTDNVRDYLNLDLLDSIHTSTSMTQSQVLGHVQEHISDERFISTGVERIAQIWTEHENAPRRLGAGTQLSTELLTGGNMEVLLTCMKDHHSCTSDEEASKKVQTNCCNIILQVINNGLMPAMGPYVVDSPLCVNALVDAMRKYPEDVGVNEAALNALVVIEQVTVSIRREDEEGWRIPFFENFVAQAGAIPLLFQAMERFPPVYDRSGGNEPTRVASLAMTVLARAGTARRGVGGQILFDYVRDHPDWRSTSVDVVAGHNSMLLEHFVDDPRNSHLMRR